MKPGAPRVQKAADSNVRTEREVVYPFGVQNDLGHVVLTRNAKVWIDLLTVLMTSDTFISDQNANYVYSIIKVYQEIRKLE